MPPLRIPFANSRVDPVRNASAIHLPGKAVNHGFHCVGLIGLDFELQFHAFLCTISSHFSEKFDLAFLSICFY